MINSMTIAVPCENLGHLLQHVVDGLVLLEGQAGEVVHGCSWLHSCLVQSVLTALAGKLCTRHSFRFGLSKVVQRWRIPELSIWRGRQQVAIAYQQPCNCRYTPRATAGILNPKTIFWDPNLTKGTRCWWCRRSWEGHCQKRGEPSYKE